MKETTQPSYKPLFRVETNLCLNAEFLLKGSLGLGEPIIILKDGTLHSFINKEKEKLCLDKELEIFSSKEKYKEYSSNFRKYIEYVNKEIIPKYSSVPEKITKKELTQLFPILQKFWNFYGITEFSYHNKAYDEMIRSKDPILKENLEDLGKLKFEGRKVLNDYLNSDGVIQNILEWFSINFFNNSDDANNLFSEELISLYDGKSLESEIKERKVCQGVGIYNKEFVKLSHEQSLALADIMIQFSPQNVIKGISAVQGISKGKVVVAPMLTDREEIKKIIKKMNHGDILVAHSTTPEWLPLIEKASAIVTDQGGMLSHAAIVSRENNIPCIIGTEIATKVLKTGDLIEVNATKATVKKL